MQSDVAALFQADERGGGFIPVVAEGVRVCELGRLSFHAAAEVLGTAINRRAPQIAPAADPRMRGIGLGQAAYAPAFGGEGLAGVLLFGRRPGAAPFDADLLDIDAVLKGLAVGLLMAASSDSVAISSYDPEFENVVTLIELGRGRDSGAAEQPGTAYSLAAYPATRWVLRTRKPLEVLVSDPNADRAEVELMRQPGMKALFLLPLVAHDQVIGLVELGDVCAERKLTEREIELAQALANQAAVALLNAQLYKASEARAAELELLSP